jgi:hypothetical protein
MGNIRHIFAMTGAVPNKAGLGGCVLLDAKGFIKTGTDLSRDDLMTAIGRLLDLRIFSKRVCPECSRLATFVPAM